MSKSLINNSESLNPFAYKLPDGVTPENFSVHNSPSMWFKSNPAYFARKNLFFVEKNASLISDNNIDLIDFNRLISGMSHDLYNNGGGNEIRWNKSDKFNLSVDRSGLPFDEAENLKKLYKKIHSFVAPIGFPCKNKKSILSYFLEILLTNSTYFSAKLVNGYIPNALEFISNPPSIDD